MSYSEFEHMRALRWAKKMKAIEYLGGSCLGCEENDFLVLEFHHIYKESKKYDIARIYSHTINNILKEVKKCKLLCCNCHAVTHSDRGAIYKESMLKYKGAKGCIICGYNEDNAALDFHHIDASGKKFGLSNKSYSKNSSDKVKLDVEMELDKCEVLCKNCHRKKHFKQDVLRLLPLINEKKSTHIPNSSPLSKKRVKDMNKKWSKYRCSLANMIIQWKSSGKNIQKAATIMDIDANTLSDNLHQSKAYRRYRAIKSKKTSKYQGVSWIKGRNKWMASVKVKGKTKNLGRYDSEDDAKDAYLRFKRKVGIV